MIFEIILNNGETWFDDFSKSIEEAKENAINQPQWKNKIIAVKPYSAKRKDEKCI